MTTPKALYRTPVDLVNTPKAFANPSPGLERSDNPGIEYKKTIKPRRGSSLMRTLSESVGKIKIRKKQGMKNHSSSSKNSLQGKYAQEIF